MTTLSGQNGRSFQPSAFRGLYVTGRVPRSNETMQLSINRCRVKSDFRKILDLCSIRIPQFTHRDLKAITYERKLGEW